MHLRLPLVFGVVALAAGAAFVRARVAAPLVPAASSTPAHAVANPSSFEPSAPRRQKLLAARAAIEAVVVYVAGDVTRPGLYTLPHRSRAADAVRAAGGARADADLVALNLAAPISDGDEVAVYAKAEDTPATVHRRGRRTAPGAAASGATRSGSHRKKKHTHKRRVTANSESSVAKVDEGPNEIVDLNSADASELETLPGIGSALAARIVAVRDASGPFASTDDLLDVGGMTQSHLDAMLPFVVVR